MTINEQSLILIINSGSTSIKYSVFTSDSLTRLQSGVIETPHAAKSRVCVFDDTGNVLLEMNCRLGSVDACCEWLYQQLTRSEIAARISVVVHRVVHGGSDYRQVTHISKAVLADLQNLTKLAPLHNQDNLAAIRFLMHLTEVPQLAVFDTAFHHSLPPVAYRYAIPEAWYQEFHIRRYGFHGISHQYVATEAAAFLQKPLAQLNLITLHLGGGASICAIQNGKSVDTSMGFTPLEGLMMGTRSGDLDAEIPLYIQQQSGFSAGQVQSQLHHEAGLQAIGGTADMRELLHLEQSGEKAAGLAIDMFVYRIRKYIGAYFAVLGQVDAVIFTGGIGENMPEIRTRCCDAMTGLGLSVSTHYNHQTVNAIQRISADGQAPAVLVVPTDEALQMARECKNYNGHSASASHNYHE